MTRLKADYFRPRRRPEGVSNPLGLGLDFKVHLNDWQDASPVHIGKMQQRYNMNAEYCA